MQAQVIIGLEVHVQLQTQSKLFCGCVNRFNPDAPNTQTCPVCLGLPGALPVLNRQAVQLAMKAGMALGCEITQPTKWDRKQYYYPDLPKAYQISQYDFPICQHGQLTIPAMSKRENQTAGDDTQKNHRTIRILRAHLEEDAGKNQHDESGRGGDSRVDLNRCGTPLLEIVTEPDLRSAEEAREFLNQLKQILTYVGVSDCNMQEGSLRCDANVNLHIQQNKETIATPIAEIKNLNSFRGVEAAIQHEQQRQLKQYQATGEKLGDPGVFKETRGWDVDRNRTILQRGKEEAADYRYFPDPDLVPYVATTAELAAVRDSLIELPHLKRQRFLHDYEISEYDAGVIVDQGPEFSDYFEQIAQLCGDGKQAANWMTQDVLRELNERNLSIDEFPMRFEVLGHLIQQVVSKTISVKSGRELFQLTLDTRDTGKPVTSQDLDRWISERGLAIVSDTSALIPIVDRLLSENERIATDLKNGKLQAAGPLIGQVMRECAGADAKVVRELIIERAQAS